MIYRLWPSPRFRLLLAPLAAASVLTCASPASAGFFFHRHAPPKSPSPAPAPYAYTPAPPPAPPPAPEPSADAAVRQVLDAQAAAWNRGDLDGFMAGYWQSPDLTFFSGSDRTAGWQATLDRYRKRYQADGKEMGRLTFSDLSVEMLGPDHALVRGRWALQLSKEAPSGLFTLLFRQTPDGWRIIHDHTSK